MKKMKTISLALLLSACAPFAPSEGKWTMTEGEVLEETCNFPEEETEEIEEASDLTFSLALTDEGFSITGEEEGAETVACTLEGKEFGCAPISENMLDEETITISIAIKNTGTFGSDKELLMTIASEVSCVGDDCESAAQALGFDFPCYISGTSTATLNE